MCREKRRAKCPLHCKKNVKMYIVSSMKKIMLFIACCLCLLSCSLSSGKKIDRVQTKKEIYARKKLLPLKEEIASVHQKKQAAIEQYMNSLSLEEKICQLFIVNLEGDRTFVPVEKMTAVSSGYKDGVPVIPGGYLFFSYNLAETPEEVIGFTDSIREFCIENDCIPPFLAVDQEGGYVNRLRTLNGPLPSAERVSSRLPVEKAYRLYSLQAVQMKSLGFSVNMAPVVEICTDMNREFLDGRSFGDAAAVEQYSRACVNAYENNGIGTVPKHFPGNTNTDPHTGLPEIRLSKENLYSLLAPFRKIVSARPAGMLMSHARTSCIDSKTPACLSYEWVTKTLKDTYGFEGIVFSDDIFMGALSGNGYPPEKACVQAIEAGVDCIMISEKRIADPAKVLVEHALADEAFSARITDAAKKMILFKLKYGILEWQREQGGKAYSINPCVQSESAEDRLVHFYDARNENREFYIENF